MKRILIATAILIATSSAFAYDDPQEAINHQLMMNEMHQQTELMRQQADEQRRNSY